MEHRLTYVKKMRGIHDLFFKEIEQLEQNQTEIDAHNLFAFNTYYENLEAYGHLAYRYFDACGEKLSSKNSSKIKKLKKIFNTLRQKDIDRTIESEQS